jgi:microcystin-dependent protein
MALETASYINGLVPANPLGADPIAQADDHIRLIKSTLKATFPNISGPVTLNQAQLNAAAPIGSIVMWFQGSLPSGWVLCNGQTVAKSDGSGNITTPNLLDRLPIAAGGSYGLNTTAGNRFPVITWNQMPVHNHAANTDTVGNHTHHVVGNTGGAGGHSHTLPNLGSVQAGSDNGGANVPVNTGYGSGRLLSPTDPVGDHGHYFEVDSWGAGSHAHGVSVGNAGSSSPMDVLNPVYGLYFIMKV